jgi:hypothetical protein
MGRRLSRISRKFGRSPGMRESSASAARMTRLFGSVSRAAENGPSTTNSDSSAGWIATVSPTSANAIQLHTGW